MAKAKPPVMFLEYCDKRNSGFVKKGTEGTPFHDELNCPSVAWIPSRGKTAVIEIINGVETNVYKEIRWINGCNTIDVEEQDRKGIKPNPKEDLIVFEKGFATIPKEGSTLSLYDYLEKVFFNGNSAGRPDHIEPLYKVMQLDKQAEEINESDVEMADAIQLVSSLRIKTGDKKTPYKYNEERLSSICDICQVHADTAAQKLYALMSLAKAKPRWFLDLVVKFEQTILTEVAHALELKVVMFDGNAAVYSEDKKLVYNLGAGNFKHEKKIEMLADYLKSKDAAESLTELRAKVSVAKENSLK